MSIFFIPYGADEDFDYEKNNKIDVELNNNLAKDVDNEYVNTILEKLEGPIYFYHCKNLESKNKCL